MNIIKIVSATLVVGFMTVGTAQAALITGWMQLGMADNSTIDLNTVDDTVTFNVNDDGNALRVSAANGDFASLVGTEGTIKDFDYTPTMAAVNDFFSVGGLTFDVDTMVIELESANSVTLYGIGTFSMGDFTDTVGEWRFTANDFDAASDYTGSWSATVVPEPASIALLGLGLLGMGAARRRA